MLWSKCRQPAHLNLLFCIVICMLLMLGCHSKTCEISGFDDPESAEKGEVVYVWREFQPEMRAEDVRWLKDVLTEKIIPIVPVQEKDELNEIIQYLDDVQERAPGYFNDEKNLVEFFKMVMRFYQMSARVNPDNFDLHLILATKYIEIAVTLEGGAESIECMRTIEDFKRKGVLASKALIEKFPQNPRSYAQHGHTLFYVKGKAKEAAVFFKKCLELDKRSAYCGENHAIVMDALRSSSQ